MLELISVPVFQAKTPEPVRHPWTTSNVIAGGHRDDDLEKTTTNE